MENINEYKNKITQQDLAKLDNFIQKCLDKFYFTEPKKEYYDATGELKDLIISHKSTIPDLVIWNKKFNKNDCFEGSNNEIEIPYPRFQFFLHIKSIKKEKEKEKIEKRKLEMLKNKMRFKNNKSNFNLQDFPMNTKMTGNYLYKGNLITNNKNLKEIGTKQQISESEIIPMNPFFTMNNNFSNKIENNNRINFTNNDLNNSRQKFELISNNNNFNINKNAYMINNINIKMQGNYFPQKLQNCNSNDIEFIFNVINLYFQVEGFIVFNSMGNYLGKFNSYLLYIYLSTQFKKGNILKNLVIMDINQQIKVSGYKMYIILVKMLPIIIKNKQNELEIFQQNLQIINKNLYNVDNKNKNPNFNNNIINNNNNGSNNNNNNDNNNQNIINMSTNDNIEKKYNLMNIKGSNSIGKNFVFNNDKSIFSNLFESDEILKNKNNSNSNNNLPSEDKDKINKNFDENSISNTNLKNDDDLFDEQNQRILNELLFHNYIKNP